MSSPSAIPKATSPQIRRDTRGRSRPAHFGRASSGPFPIRRGAYCSALLTSIVADRAANVIHLFARGDEPTPA